MAEGQTLGGIWLGTRPYRPVLELQNRLREAVFRGERSPTVLLLEHRPVVTLGKGAHEENVLLSEEALAARGFDVVTTDRGGDVTVHAPGQLVAYPIIDLRRRRDVRWYVRLLTDTMRAIVGGHGVAAGEIEGMVGLWVDAAAPRVWEGAARAARPVKIGAIGVRVSRWVTMHGFALNLMTDLSAFDCIVPCGLHGYGVTSLRALTGLDVLPRDAAAVAHTLLAERLELAGGELVDASTQRVEALKEL
jgi:lipoyl(octanoyl) transferase